MNHQERAVKIEKVQINHAFLEPSERPVMHFFHIISISTPSQLSVPHLPARQRDMQALD